MLTSLLSRTNQQILNKFFTNQPQILLNPKEAQNINNLLDINTLSFTASAQNMTTNCDNLQIPTQQDIQQKQIDSQQIYPYDPFFKWNYSDKQFQERLSLSHLPFSANYNKLVQMYPIFESDFHSLRRSFKTAVKVLEASFEKYKNLSLAFNGGKDSIVLYHLVQYFTVSHMNKKIHEMDDRLLVFKFLEDNDFPEMHTFYKQVEQEEKLNIMYIPTHSYFDPVKKEKKADFKKAMNDVFSGFKTAKGTNLDACFLGVRNVDPAAKGSNQSLKDKSLKSFSTNSIASNPLYFQKCDVDKGWPELMRIYPLYDWSYRDVWLFILLMNLRYCSLYDLGYTSLGDIESTKKNTLLRIEPPKDPKIVGNIGAHAVPERYLPAYCLRDGDLERAGRY